MNDNSNTAGYDHHSSLFAGNSVCHTATHHRHAGHCPARGHKKGHKKPHHPGHLHFKLPKHIEDQPF